MTAASTPRRITGPLKTWYDLHEALQHEATALADQGARLVAAGLDAFAQRFAHLDAELRTHSRVEDGIMFPAIEAKGGNVAAKLFSEHRDEALLTYGIGASVMSARATGDAAAIARLSSSSAALRDSLVAHLRLEEDEVLGHVDDLFSPEEQAALLREIIAAMPPDPDLQPWIAGALTPEHLEARLRNMAGSLDRAALVGVLTQIHDGVDASVWAEIEARTPELAALVPGDRAGDAG